MPSRVSPFRPAGGLLTPDGPTGRPGWSAVGVGPAGRAPGRPDPVPAPGAPSELLGSEVAVFDGWMKSRVGREAVETTTAAIRAARQFDEWGFSDWWAKHRNDADALAKEGCMRFFRRPFSGALVERTARREVAEGTEPGPWRDEPMVVRGFADAGELTGFERPGEHPTADIPVVNAVPRLALRVEELVRQGYLLAPAGELLVQVWFVLTMRDVVLHRVEPPKWNAVARREVDLRSPAILQKVVWMIDGKWSPF